jgi:hypothetical protein
MDSKRFDELSEQRVKECLNLMREKKGPEYQRGEDRLGAFKRAGQLLGVVPEKALLGMMVKHLISLLDLVEDIDKGREIVLSQFREKSTDAINYLLLLEGLVDERLGGTYGPHVEGRSDAALPRLYSEPRKPGHVSRMVVDQRDERHPGAEHLVE